MYIKKIHIEGGFLSGLDLNLEEGLNTIIGARGTGKTSLVQLLRYATGSQTFTELDNTENEEHAKSVLGDGQITVTFQDKNEDEIISKRGADDVGYRSTADFVEPIIFSQTEIEKIGKLESSRLELIDSFHERSIKWTEPKLVSMIKSLTKDINLKRKNLDSMKDETKQLSQLNVELRTLAKQQGTLSASNKKTIALNEKIQKLHDKISVLAVEIQRLELVGKEIDQRLSNSRNVIEKWRRLPSKFVEDKANIEVVRKLQQSRFNIEAAISDLSEVSLMIGEKLDSSNEEKIKLEQESYELRKRVSEHEKGYGEVSRNLQLVKSKIARFSAFDGLVKEGLEELEKTVSQRNSLFDELEKLRGGNFAKRLEVVENLNSKLGPAIHIEIEHQGQIEYYSKVIIDELKGSGLRVAEIAAQISEQVSPRELMYWIENFEYEQLAQVINISSDRAARLLSALRDTDVGLIGTTYVEDSVSFFLLDGTNRKSIEDLSLGQRCTVVLPIILEKQGAIIVLDQPEDHIDNAFIADTLIRSIRNRSASDQLIITTHNANIPVLGEASLVVLLESDGKRGFVKFREPLDDKKSIQAITTLMEGGKTAFETRANFYSSK